MGASLEKKNRYSSCAKMYQVQTHRNFKGLGEVFGEF